MKKFKQVKSILILTLLVCVMAFTSACSKKVAPSTQLVVTVAGTEIYLDEMMYYIYALEAEGNYYDQLYKQMGGGSYWDLEYTPGVTMREHSKQNLIDSVVMYEVLYDKALEAGFTITDEEKEEANSYSSQIMENLSVEQLKITGLTKDLLSKVQEKLIVSEKYYTSIKETIELNEEEIKASVDFDKFRQYNTEYLFISSYKVDENNGNVKMTSDELKTAKATLEKALSKAKLGTDFETIISEYPEITTSTQNFIFGANDLESEYQDAAIVLDNGEITSKVVETANGYYIIKMLDKESRESYDEAVAIALANAEEEAFQAQYEEIEKDYEVVVNEEVWDKIVIGNTTYVSLTK